MHGDEPKPKQKEKYCPFLPASEYLVDNTSYIIHSLEVVVTMTTEMCAPT